MPTRVAVIAIIIENSESAEGVNGILHNYRQYIIGRMGIPYREKAGWGYPTAKKGSISSVWLLTRRSRRSLLFPARSAASRASAQRPLTRR